ncbi:MAG TPA: condensation domain-containing protein, partial [Candidatus Dormibacteraeota bacterium]|nr:condensation domain-containing protein [Candidatus Dormibacteraeota bacterium]
MASESTAERLSRLSDRQRALLERRLRGTASTGIPHRAAPAGPAPLLHAQEQLWIIDQLTPGSTAYSLPGLLRLRGPLDRVALERSLDDLVRRHEGLRTRFPVVDGAPVQVVDPPRPAELACVEAASEERARELMAEVVSQPFDLAAGPLHREVLYRLGPRDHALLLLMHHMVSDAWSQRVLAEDLAALYEARVAGREPRLPEPSVGPGDVAAWQRARFDGPAMREHLAYWRDRLRGELPPLELPSYRPRPAVPSARGGVVERRLPDDLVDAVRGLSLRHRVTPFMTLLAAFAALLGRYTGETDVVIGTTVAQRARPELERMVANLVNTLPLRIDLSGGPTLADLLDRVRETVLDGMAHAEAPYSRIVEVVRPARSASHNPLFQVLFVLQDVSLEPLRAGELVVDVETLDVETTQFDFALTVSGGHCHLQYNADLADGETVTYLGAHYETLLRGIVAEPGRPVSRLPLLEAAERRRLLVEWNDTDRPYPRERCVHELFEARVAEAPDHVAVIMGDRRLTYGELNARANRLAHHLRGLGVGPDVLVGICVERSLDMVVAIYGVLKAGGGYVPTEPTHPPQRVDALLAGAGVRLVLTHERHRAIAAGDGGGRTVLCLDTGWEAVAARPDTNPARLARPDNLLYVMFTSGSTGAPKGVMTTHRNLVDVMAFLQRAYELRPDDRVLQHLPYSFDMSDGELFFPLLSGASTVLLPPGGHWDPARILGAVREHCVTSVQFVPSVFPALLEGGGWDECPSLRHVLSGGDALLADVNNELLRRTRGTVHNFYGPTE